MPLKEQYYSVLIVSSAEKFNQSMEALLPGTGYYPVQTVSSISAAQRCLAERSFDLVIVNAPLPDDIGRKFAIDASCDRGAVVLLLIRNELYEEIFARVMDYGVLTLRKPTSVPMLVQALDWMRATRERMRRLEKKQMTLEEKMAEIRIVNRAKWALIEVQHMTESDAHHYIEKQAMDRCVTRRVIAEEILHSCEK